MYQNGKWTRSEAQNVNKTLPLEIETIQKHDARWNGCRVGKNLEIENKRFENKTELLIMSNAHWVQLENSQIWLL